MSCAPDTRFWFFSSLATIHRPLRIQMSSTTSCGSRNCGASKRSSGVFHPLLFIVFSPGIKIRTYLYNRTQELPMNKSSLSFHTFGDKSLTHERRKAFSAAVLKICRTNESTNFVLTSYPCFLKTRKWLWSFFRLGYSIIMSRSFVKRVRYGTRNK